MLLKQIITFLTLYTSTLAAPSPVDRSLGRRDATTLLSSLQAEDAAFKQLTNDLNAWDGSSQKFVPILKDVNNLYAALKKTYNDCRLTSPSSVTTAQANALINYLTNPLEPDYYGNAAAFIAAKPIATRTGLYRIFKGFVGNIQTNTTNVNFCIKLQIPATPSNLRPAASSIAAKIDADIKSAVDAYP